MDDFLDRKSKSKKKEIVLLFQKFVIQFLMKQLYRRKVEQQIV